MICHFSIQIGIVSLPTSFEHGNENKVFKIKLQNEYVLLERRVIGNSYIWEIKFHSEGVDLIKFQNALPKMKAQINEYLFRNEKYFD